jgi:hypothetical protein
LAKRRGRPPGSGRKAGSLDGLVAELRQLDERRKGIVAQIRDTTNQLLSGLSAPEGWESSGRKRGRPPGRPVAATSADAGGGTRKRRKMSAKARKAISDAQKKRWAKQKAAAK